PIRLRSNIRCGCVFGSTNVIKASSRGLLDESETSARIGERKELSLAQHYPKDDMSASAPARSDEDSSKSYGCTPQPEASHRSIEKGVGMSGKKKILVPFDSVDIPPIVKIVQVPMTLKVKPAPGAGPAYQTSTITNGYGRAAGITVTIQLGFTVDL